MIYVIINNKEKDALLNWYRQAGYPILSTNLENLLLKAKCPEEIIELFDRALWANLSGEDLTKEFTIHEAFCLDSWVSNNKKPKDFPSKLENQLKEELGMSFGG